MQGNIENFGDQAQSLARAILEYRVFQVGEQIITIESLLVFCLILAGTFVVSYVLQRAITRVLRRRNIEEGGSLAVIRRLLHYIIVVVGLTTGLAHLGFDLAALFAAGAIFAVAIGFAMQNIAQNFVSGAILLVERSIKPHDVLELNGQIVRVTSMGIRSTIVRTLDDEDLIVPNADLVQSTVTNFTLRDSLSRLRVPVGVAYESDMRLVDATLKEAARGVAWRNQDREPRVLLTAFGSSSVDFEISVWIDRPWEMAQRRSDLHHAVWWALKDAGITIAFPQIDVHFDPPTESAPAAGATDDGDADG